MLLTPCCLLSSPDTKTEDLEFFPLTSARKCKVPLEAFNKGHPHIVEEGCPEPCGVSCGLGFGGTGVLAPVPPGSPHEGLAPRGPWLQVWLLAAGL